MVNTQYNYLLNLNTFAGAFNRINETNHTEQWCTRWISYNCCLFSWAFYITNYLNFFRNLFLALYTIILFFKVSHTVEQRGY